MAYLATIYLKTQRRTILNQEFQTYMAKTKLQAPAWKFLTVSNSKIFFYFLALTIV